MTDRLRPLVWVCVAVTSVAFFLPWARIDIRQSGLATHGLLGGLAKEIGTITVTVRRGAETITGALPTAADIPESVSGFQVPQLANQEETKAAMALLELFLGTRHHIGLKSYAVYFVPGLMWCCGILLLWGGGDRRVALSVAGVCAVLALVGFWKLLTITTETMFVAITIGPGVWLSLWAYVGLSICAVCMGCVPPRH